MAEMPGRFLEQKETDEEISKREEAQDIHESCITIFIIQVLKGRVKNILKLTEVADVGLFAAGGKNIQHF